MKMFTNVLCDPPLGQTSVIPRNKEYVKFTVLVESIVSASDQPWEVVIWHNCQHESEWTGLSLKVDTNNRLFSIASPSRPKAYQKCFTGTLPRPSDGDSAFKFTLKYRPDSSQPWKWANEDSSLTDGELLFQPKPLVGSQWIIFPDSTKEIECKRVTSDTPHTRLWYLKHPVLAAGKESGYSTHSLGRPAKLSRFSALTRLWTPWLIPEHGKSKFEISKKAIVCSFLRTDGLHAVLLALSGIASVQTVIKSSADGEVLIHSRNDETSLDHGHLLLGLGFSQETAMAACVYYARKLVGNFEFPQTLEPTNDVVSEDVGANWYVEWPDGLTYCTWNGLGLNLTEEELLHAIDDLDANGIQITNLVIDNSWQAVDDANEQPNKGWVSFEANKDVCPDGLKETLSRIKRKMPRMQTIAVWHTIIGYWGGISPCGEIAQKYKTKEVERAPMKMAHGSVPHRLITVVDEPDIQRMYDDFYDFLESSGVDAVKTDGQFLLDQMTSPSDRRAFMKSYQDAWTQSGLRHFQSKQISCMSQVPDIIFHSQLLTDKPRLMVRNSDDFYPDEPDSHPWHIFTNAHTASFTQFLNVIPDWDMFQTQHPYGSYHAAARCISGGPLYFTDKPGEHDLGLFAQICAKTTQGDTVTLRPSRFARVVQSQVYASYHEKRALKVGTFNGGKGVGTGILGVFNIDSYPVSDFVSLKEFPGVEPDQEYVVRAYSTGQVSSQMRGAEDGPFTNVFLEHKGWEIFTAYPLQGAEDAGPRVASLGLLGKMSGAVATLRFDLNSRPDGRLEINANLRALGILGLYISNLPEKSIMDSFMVTIQGEAVPVSTVAKSDEDERVLTVDVERAWKELNMHAGWSNELNVKIYMN